MLEEEQTLFRKDVAAYIEKSICDSQGTEEAGSESGHQKWQALLKNLATPPLFTTLRLNTCKYQPEEALKVLQAALEKQYSEQNIEKPPQAFIHPILPDTVVIPNSGPHTIAQHEQEVIVDVACGMAVLRGADVFAQGILAAPAGMEVGSEVSVYAAVDGKCRKGLTKTYDGRKRHVGNGVAMVSRHTLFVEAEKTQGIGIRMTSPLYRAPSLAGLLPDTVFPQNLPSILCAHVLDPRPGDTVLDMCAAPGGKTCHIATLMQNKGRVIALDKTTGKVSKIQQNAENWGISIIQAFAQDARKAVDKALQGTVIPVSPPFPAGSFARILLDAPCSALGQRPCLRNNASLAEVTSFPALQKQLFETAVSLLQSGGVLVYSTCTIPREENEDLVAWALQQFPEIQLEKQEPYLGRSGWPATGLSPQQLSLLQRFDPSNLLADPSDITDRSSNSPAPTPQTDTIGFFIAKFRKRENPVGDRDS